MPKSTSLKIHNIFGSPAKIVLTVLLSLPLFSAPQSLKNTPYFHPNASANIVIFYTTWCPPCTKSITLLNAIQKEHPHLTIDRVCVDKPKQLKLAQPFGILQSVPLILIADHGGTVVKRFNTLPDKEIFNALIQRLEEGRLENGTLPIERRVDTWKMNRKGM